MGGGGGGGGDGAWGQLLRGRGGRLGQARLALAYTAVETAAMGVRTGAALSALLLLRGGGGGGAAAGGWAKSNTVVGLAQGLNGVLQLLVALPAGVAADKARRDTTLRFGALLGLAAVAVLAAGVILDAPRFAILFSAMGLLGAYKGGTSPVVETVFADATPKGRRTGMYSARQVVKLLAGMTGPLVSVCLFLVFGNTWGARECALVVLGGAILTLPALALLPFFDDDKIRLEDEEKARLRHVGVVDGGSVPGSSSGDSSEGEGGERSDVAPRRRSLLRERRPLWGQKTIPILIVTADLIGAVAAGMTVKFFPLFFYEICDFDPVTVSAISAGGPLFIAFLTMGAARLARRAGKIRTAFLCRFLDVALLLLMVFLPTDPGIHQAVLVGVHLLRTGTANAPQPLVRATLMDNVPKGERARWNSIDGIWVFSWSGSAALGGFLIDHFKSFQKTFLVTAIIKAVSLLPLLVLCIWMGREDMDDEEAGGEHDLKEPLLGASDSGDSDGEDRATGVITAKPGSPELSQDPVTPSMTCVSEEGMTLPASALPLDASVTPAGMPATPLPGSPSTSVSPAELPAATPAPSARLDSPAESLTPYATPAATPAPSARSDSPAESLTPYATPATTPAPSARSDSPAESLTPYATPAMTPVSSAATPAYTPTPATSRPYRTPTFSDSPAASVRSTPSPMPTPAAPPTPPEYF